MMYRFGIAVLCLLATQLALGAEPPTTPKPLASWEQNLEVAGILANVPELKHPMPKGWQPTLYWEPPKLSVNDPAKLKVELAELWKRGIVPRVSLTGDYGVPANEVDAAVAEAKAIADAGLPVNIQILGGLDLYKLENGKLLRHNDKCELPCLTIKDGWKHRGDYLRSLYKKFTDAKVPVAAVWFDYEGTPYAWNGQYEAAKACPTCSKLIPADMLKTREMFVAYACNLFLEAFDEAFGKPTREAFPKAVIGQYDYEPSSDDYPVFMCYNMRLPACPNNKSTLIQAAMPPLYVWPAALRKKFYNADWAVPQTEADGIYFCTLLQTASNIHHNLRPDQRLIPFVSDYVIFTPGEGPLMSDWMYRECLRHILLRGEKGLYCYCVAPPFGPLLVYYHSLAQINAVYNEFFAYPEFLEKGKVLNDAVLPPKVPGVVWSGLGLPDKALIRVIALGRSAPEMVEITPFPGVSVRLMAPPGGQTYIVEPSGQTYCVK